MILSGQTPYIHIQWGNPRDVSGNPLIGFKIEMSTTRAFPGTIIYVKNDVNILDFKIRNLKAGQIYYFILTQKI